MSCRSPRYKLGHLLLDARPASYWLRPSASLDFHSGPLPGEPPDATFQNVCGARVHYVEQGSGSPVVLLHGFASSLDIWCALLPDLAKQHRVIAVDLKGFGWTDRPDGDYSARAQAQLVWTLLDKLGIGEAALVGHSWGASVVLAMALAAPRRATRLAFYNAWAYEAQLTLDYRCSRLLGIGEALFGWYDSSWARGTLALGFHRPGQVTSDMVRRLKWRMDRPGARAAALATLRAMRFAEQERRYRSLEHPSLILWGQHDAISALAFGRQLAADLRAQLLVFPQCGHFPMIEAAEVSTRALQSFLAAP